MGAYRSSSLCRISSFHSVSAAACCWTLLKLQQGNGIRCFSSSSKDLQIPNSNPYPLSDFLLYECGFSAAQVSTIQKREAPLSRMKSIQRCRDAVALFRDQGFSDSQVRKLVLRYPCVLRFKAREALTPKLHYIRSLGLSEQAARSVVTRDPNVLGIKNLASNIRKLAQVLGSPANLIRAVQCHPRILTCSPKTIERRIHVFRDLGLQGKGICRQLMMHPQLLTRSERHLNLQIKFYRNLGVEISSKTFSHAVGWTIGYSMEKLKEKVESFRDLGLLDAEIKELVKKLPVVLILSMDKKKETMDYLINEAGLPPNVVVRCPTLLTLSLAKRIRPRHAVFTHLLSSNSISKPLPQLHYFIAMPESDFVKRYLEENPDQAEILDVYIGAVGTCR